MSNEIKPLDDLEKKKSVSLEEKEKEGKEEKKGIPIVSSILSYFGFGEVEGKNKKASNKEKETNKEVKEEGKEKSKKGEKSNSQQGKRKIFYVGVVVIILGLGSGTAYLFYQLYQRHQNAQSFVSKTEMARKLAEYRKKRLKRIATETVTTTVTATDKSQTTTKTKTVAPRKEVAKKNFGQSNEFVMSKNNHSSSTTVTKTATKGTTVTTSKSAKKGKTAGTTKEIVQETVQRKKETSKEVFNFKAFQEFYLKLLLERIKEEEKRLAEIETQKQKIAEEIQQLKLQITQIALVKPVKTKTKEEKKKVVFVPKPITVYGVSCKGNSCRAFTNLGILKKGSRIDEGERVLKVTPHLIKTNYREIEF